ncbi:DivIVA domain-containing protein [Pseudonocardia sp. N23]|uniref:DivIVA domain-containing protein n=1 Tax=Pseudonocardia sp. N23 TaxID=1987376 RepID=UPI000C02A22E|nr:DivIVA domain-containing protein [Pseudonocardia sp. N23]GAY12382.1 probable myosin [Pseudonocardia sp. N23]
MDTHLQRVDADLRMVVADRDAAAAGITEITRELDVVRSENEALRLQVRKLSAPPQDVAGMSERLRTMLRLAQEEVAEVRARADGEIAQARADMERDASRLVADARAEAARIVEEARQAKAAVESHRAAVEDDLARRQAVAEAEIRAGDDQARAHREGLLAESEQRRREVDEDFTIAMNQRRSEALAALTTERTTAQREIAQRRADSQDEAAATLARAQQQARSIVADAEAHLVELTQLRGRIAEQLSGSRARIDQLLEVISPLHGEAELLDRRPPGPLL